jgi:ATP-dependent RNA helicase DDX56/DBP9
MSLLDPSLTFTSLADSVGLDIRLRKAVSRLGLVRPTLVQSKCLPLALSSGRDLLVRARTGSGKTLAYCLPLLQKILQGGLSDSVRALVLVPTRELCTQVNNTMQSLIYYCDEAVSVAVLSSGRSGREKDKQELARQEAMLRDRPDVIVATPAGVLKHIRSGVLNLKASVETLVVDEADLVLSFGYANDIAEITKALPKICQGFLMSATLSPELNSLKKVVLHSPAVLKLEEEEEKNIAGKNGQLSQFYLATSKKDKNLVLYVFLKVSSRVDDVVVVHVLSCRSSRLFLPLSLQLGLLKGKGLFFVNSTDGGYRLKLFLEQFHIRSAVLNAELPLRSRLNIIDQFNIGNFDYLIATDESADVGKESHSSDDEDERSTKKKAGRKKDLEYGVSRGLDFRNVSFVVNVDFPPSAKSYTHRVGRTARGGAKGVALSLVEQESNEQHALLQAVQEDQPAIPLAIVGNETLQTARPDLEGEAAGITQPPEMQPQPSLLDFDLKEIEGFRYRVEDVTRAVTKTAVRETRAAELRAEILNSERLQSHFDDNPAELQLLQHDRVATHVSKVQPHLK